MFRSTSGHLGHVEANQLYRRLSALGQVALQDGCAQPDVAASVDEETLHRILGRWHGVEAGAS